MKALGARPTPSAAFTTRAQTALATLEAHVAQGGTVSNDVVENIWDHDDCRGVLTRHQKGTCAYCESRITGHHRHVDHMAPKVSVADLDQPGTEDRETGQVSGRTLQNARPGYWWRAYDWSNYVVTCFGCNSRWKRTLYPLQSGPRRCDPVRGAPETPLLLDPYVDADTERDPARHLAFDDGAGVPGQVQGASPFGDATVATCGLDRPSLVDARSDLARTVVDLIDALYEEGDHRNTWRRLHGKGTPAPGREFVGMVRAMVWRELEMSWRDVEHFAGAC